jgi:virginiamycin A acetyltransferase
MFLNGAIVAARSVVVVSDVPAYSVVGGNPARVIRQRFPAEVVNELLAIQWWDWPVDQITRNLPAIVGADVAALKNAD